MESIPNPKASCLLFPQPSPTSFSLRSRNPINQTHNSQHHTQQNPHLPPLDPSQTQSHPSLARQPPRALPAQIPSAQIRQLSPTIFTTQKRRTCADITALAPKSAKPSIPLHLSQAIQITRTRIKKRLRLRQPGVRQRELGDPDGELRVEGADLAEEGCEALEAAVEVHRDEVGLAAFSVGGEGEAGGVEGAEPVDSALRACYGGEADAEVVGWLAEGGQVEEVGCCCVGGGEGGAAGGGGPVGFVEGEDVRGTLVGVGGVHEGIYGGEEGAIWFGWGGRRAPEHGDEGDGG